MATHDMARQIEAVRRFNRFYTRQIGVLDEGLLESPFSLTEARVIYELAHHEEVTASTLGAELGLDAGYLSRILAGFRRRGLIIGRQSATDGRRSILSLTELGKEAFATLNNRSRDQIEGAISKLGKEDRTRLVESMEAIENLLEAPAEQKAPYILRSHRPGDMGWVVHRHGTLYYEEYGWDERFEALVAEVVAEFIHHFDPERERCWLVERDGEIVGSVFLVRATSEIAKLRLLLVEPSARGLGIGRRLVDECIAFARQAGYRSLMLWTNNVLDAARHIYEKAGFRMVKSEPHSMFGSGLIGETWELVL